MDNKEKYNHWEEYAQYDLDTAEVMLENKRYLYAIFMCQQAIEKIVKGLYVLYTGDEPIKTHNIALIFNNLCKNKDFLYNKQESNFIQQKEKFTPYFVRLLAFYISARYPDYKEKIGKSLSEAEAKDLLDKTKEMFVWLQSLRKFLK